MKKNMKNQRWLNGVSLACLGLLAMPLAFAGQAQAQDAVEASVLERPRADYDANGIDLFAGKDSPGAPFVLYPSFTIDALYDDNVFREENNEDDDLFIRLKPEVTIASDWDNHALSLGARADIGRYETFDENDYEDVQAFIEGRVDVTEDTNIFGGADWGRYHNARDDVDLGIADTKIVVIDRNTQTLGFETKPSDWLLRVWGSRAANNFFDSDFNQDDRDFTQWDARAKLGYEFQPGVLAFVVGGYNWRVYDDETDDFGYQRDSTGWDVAGGLAYEISDVLKAEVTAGYQKQTFADDRLGATGGFTVGGDITWNPTDLMTVRMGAATGVQETTLQALGSAETISANVGMDYEVTDALLWTNNLSYSIADYSASDVTAGVERRKDKAWVGSTGLIFKINEFFEMQGTYTFTTRDSNISGEDFEGNTFLISLKSQL